METTKMIRGKEGGDRKARQRTARQRVTWTLKASIPTVESVSSKIWFK